MFVEYGLFKNVGHFINRVEFVKKVKKMRQYTGQELMFIVHKSNIAAFDLDNFN